MSRRRHRPGLSVVAVLASAAGLAACDSDPEVDLDEVGRLLADDGAAMVEEFRTEEPRMGEMIDDEVVEDASADVECDEGRQRVWQAEFTMAWPGDAADLEHVDTVFDGISDFLAGRFGELDYETVHQSFGDGAEPRSADFRRPVAEGEVELEFAVTYHLTAPPDGQSFAADFGIAGSTSCWSR